MARKLEAQLDGMYLMSSVLMTSTMKSEPGRPLTRASSRGLAVSAAAGFAEGGKAEGGPGGCGFAPGASAAAAGAMAVAAPAAITPPRNCRRPTFFELELLRA